MAKPNNMEPELPHMSREGLNIPWLHAILGGLLALALAGTLGFYIGKNQIIGAGTEPTATAQATALPKGITRLPVQKFGNWNLNCLQNLEKQKKCELVLRAVDKTRKALVLSLVVARNAKGEALLVVVTPPSVTFSAGVQLAAGTGQPVTAAFASCRPGSCQAAISLADPTAEALSSADFLQVSYVAGAGNKVSYKLPMTGFREGYAAWQAS